MDGFVTVGILMAHMVKRMKENAISRAEVIAHKSAGDMTHTLCTLSKIKVFNIYIYIYLLFC